MRWLKPRRRDEGGAIAIFIALILTAVFLGGSVLVVDLSQLYAEKRQLQNGADGAALAVIQTCARGACDSSTSASGTAGSLANANANDNASNVLPGNLCGNGYGNAAWNGIPSCPAPTTKNWECPPLPAGNTAAYIQVYTTTKRSDGSTLIPPSFARALGFTTGNTVIACSRASMGYPGGLGSQLPITISYCEWLHDTSNGTVFATPQPPYPTYPPASMEQTLIFHTASSATNADPTKGCVTFPAGQDLAGGFGWLTADPSPPGNGCTTTTVNGTAPANTGRNGGALVTCIYNAWLARQVVYVPIYDYASGTGNNGTYTITGYAAFYITGYSFNGNANGGGNNSPAQEPSPVPGTTTSCTANTNCLYGFFLKTLVSGIPSSGGGQYYYGATVIGLTG